MEVLGNCDAASSGPLSVKVVAAAFHILFLSIQEIDTQMASLVYQRRVEQLEAWIHNHDVFLPHISTRRFMKGSFLIPCFCFGG